MGQALQRDTMTKRVVRRSICAKFAASALGPIISGCEIFALSKGQYSTIDVIEHCLRSTGPADILAATWNCAPNDGRFLANLADAGLIRSIRFILDHSFQVREPASIAFLVERFGAESIRTTVNHAKFIVIRNADWNVCIRTSANLNENLRMELFEVSDCAAMASFLNDYADEVFRLHGAHESRAKSEAMFKSGDLFGERLDSESQGRRIEGISVESRKYLGTGRYDTDVRRAGVARA